MHCVNCGHSQETGKFCGKCGTKFDEGIVVNDDSTVPEQAATAEFEQQPTVVAEPNVHVEKIKAQSKMYGSYFMRQLKRPSLAFNQDTTAFSNGLISTILLGIMIALSLYTFTNNVWGSGYGPGFISVFGSILIFSTIFMGIAILSLFIINRFFGPQLSFKSIVSVYGGHLSPLLIGSGVSFLLMLLKSYTFGNLILSLVFIFAVFILPLFLISTLLTKKPTGFDPLYGFMLYIVTFLILFFIFITILADSTIGEYFEELTYWL